MRTALILATVLGPLAVSALNLERGLEVEGGIQDSPAAPASDSLGDGTALYEQWPKLGSVPVNRTEGLIRSRKLQHNNLLEARQTDVCLDPGYILVCPVTDPFPCCDPKFPICCHTSTCCPTGTFCVGELSCCQLGTTACNEGCCPTGTTCCGNACCTPGYACVSAGNCQSTSTVTSSSFRNITSFRTATNSFTGTNSFSGTNPRATSTSAPFETSDPSPPNNAAVIGGAVGGTVGGLALIGGCVAIWYFYTHGAATAAGATAAAGAAGTGAAGASGASGNAGTLGNTGAAGAAHAQGYGWGGASGSLSGSPSVGQPLMTSTSMPFTPAATANAGFGAQQTYGAPSSPYLQQPLTPSNGTDYSQPPVSQYSPGAYGAAIPPSSASGPVPWGGSPPSSHTGGSVYGGVSAEATQPGHIGYGGFDSSAAYAQSRTSPGPQVQTWVERSGGN